MKKNVTLNQPTDDLARELGQVLWISLDLLDVSPINPRKTFDEAALRELTASIRESGVLTPLLVRPGRPAPRCEIVAGHRRFEAAKIVGLFSVPCFVREMDDATAADVALIDNLQRADVPALEEAEALGQLLTRLGSVQAVAAKVGKDVAHIAKRLKLLSLTLSTQDALRERLITVDHALLLARLGEQEQNDALKWTIDHNAGSTVPVDEVIAEALDRCRGVNKNDVHGICKECGCTEDEPCELEEGSATCSRANAEGTLCTNPDCLEAAGQGKRRPAHRYTWEPQSVQRLKDHIEVESGIPLSRAPWAMGEDWLLIDTCSCLDCPKNTQANAPLFADLNMGEPICTDGACFREKTEAFVELQQRDAAKGLAEKLGRTSPGDVEILQVSWKPTSTVPRQLKDGGGANPAQTFKDGQWVEAKKSCENARPAVTVDWSDSGNRGYMGRDEALRKPGEVVQVCIDPKCKVHPKEYAKAKPKGEQREKPESEADRKKRQEDEARLVKTEAEIRAKVFGAVLSALDAKKAIHILADRLGGAPGFRKQLLAKFPKMPAAELEAFVLICGEFHSHCRPNSYWMKQQKDGVKSDRAELWALANAAGVDPDVLAAKHFHDTFADPVSLKSLNPELDPLYPKAVKWPKFEGKPAAKKSAKKAAKPAKTAAKKTAKK